MTGNVTPLRRAQVIDEDYLCEIEEWCDLARKGDIVEMCVIVNHADDGYARNASFQDRVRLIGYLMMLIFSVERAHLPQRE